MSIRAKLKYHFNEGYCLWVAVVTWLRQIEKKMCQNVDLMAEEQIKAIHSFRSSGSAACFVMFFPITLLFVQTFRIEWTL